MKLNPNQRKDVKSRGCEGVPQFVASRRELRLTILPNQTVESNSGYEADGERPSAARETRALPKTDCIVLVKCFFCASGKPLKRFLKHTPLNTRLKPGVNEKGATAKRTEVRAPWADCAPINSLSLRTFASLR